MKEAFVTVGKDQNISVEVKDVEIPEPGPDQVLIKVVYSGTNPKDWKVPIWLAETQNHTDTGDDIAGLVHKVGTNVTEFKPGDRVAAFHEMRTPHGSFAEYAIAPAHTTFHIPSNTDFASAAAIPLAAMTAAIGLFCRLGVPEPWVKHKLEREKVQGGIVVYGAASAVGAYAIKLLQLTDIHPIIAVAGRGTDFVETLIDREKGDTIVDYRDGDDKVIQGIKSGVVSGQKLKYAYDAVSDHNSYVNICQVLDRDGGFLTTVLPGKKYEGIPETVNHVPTQVGSSHGDDALFAHAWFRLFSKGLQDGWFTAHPTETIPGGLEGVVTGLKNLQEGKASSVKYVYKIDETKGAEKSGV